MSLWERDYFLLISVSFSEITFAPFVLREYAYSLSNEELDIIIFCSATIHQIVKYYCSSDKILPFRNRIKSNSTLENLKLKREVLQVTIIHKERVD